MPTTQSVYPNLEELRLLWDPARSRSYTFDPVREEGEKLPALRTLDLRGALIQPDFYSILPATLEILRLDSGSIDTINNMNFLELGENSLPNLKTLIFNDCPWVNSNILFLFLLHSKAPLETLHINFCHKVSGNDFLNMLSDPGAVSLKGLTELGVACMADMDDINVPQLWATLPNVSVLDLSQTKITGCTIRMFADARNEGAGGVEFDALIIKGCDDVSRDAIDYGRQMGLKIVT
jgi:F-box/TPR repeat protein Pof3